MGEKHFKGTKFVDPCKGLLGNILGLKSSLKYAQKNFKETKDSYWLEQVKDLSMQILAIKKAYNACVLAHGGKAESYNIFARGQLGMFLEEDTDLEKFDDVGFGWWLILRFEAPFGTRFGVLPFSSQVTGIGIKEGAGSNWGTMQWPHFQPQIGSYDPGTGKVSLSSFWFKLTGHGKTSLSLSGTSTVRPAPPGPPTVEMTLSTSQEILFSLPVLKKKGEYLPQYFTKDVSCDIYLKLQLWSQYPFIA